MWKKFLYEDEINSGMCGPNGLTPLHVAILHSRPDIVRILLDYGANVNAGGYTPRHDVNLVRRQSAIHMATCQGNLDLVRLLLDYKSYLLADPTEETGLSMLHIATLHGHEHLIRHLVTEGCLAVDHISFDARNYSYRLALMTTAAQCAARTVAGRKTLLLFRDLGADMNLVVLALLQQPHPAAISLAVQLLTKPEEWNVDAGAQVGEPDVGQCNLADAILELYLGLHITADTVSAWHPILQTALDDGADVDRCFRLEYVAEGKPLLEMAFANTFGQKSLLLLQQLLERGARVQKLRQPHDASVEDDGNCLLLRYLESLVPGYGEEQYWVSKPRYVWDELRDMELFADATANTTIATVAERKIEALLASGARVDGVSRRGKTYLMSACELVDLFRFPLGFMRMLLVAGADPNQPSRSHDPCGWRWNDSGGPESPMAACLSFPCPPADSSSSYRACELLQSYGGRLLYDGEGDHREGLEVHSVPR
ncbi:uncharacterized protein PG998_014585 [Apiospora kogelbergensis]|uniref:uncharacterized protein n=1 Tax=Apiospora kogelbergensis TaxID=1337665 RepID=UPI003131009D